MTERDHKSSLWITPNEEDESEERGSGLLVDRVIDMTVGEGGESKEARVFPPTPTLRY